MSTNNEHLCVYLMLVYLSLSNRCVTYETEERSTVKVIYFL